MANQRRAWGSVFTASLALYGVSACGTRVRGGSATSDATDASVADGRLPDHADGGATQGDNVDGGSTNGGGVDGGHSGLGSADASVGPRCGARIASYDYERPYGPNAPWNVPACDLPEDARSADWVKRLFLYGRSNPTMPPEDSPDVVGLSQFSTLFGVGEPAGSDFSVATYRTLDPNQGANTTHWVFDNESDPGRFNYGPRASGTHCAPSYLGGACDSAKSGGADDEQIPFNDAWRPPNGSDGHTVIYDQTSFREYYLWAWTGPWTTQNCGLYPRNATPWTGPTTGVSAPPVFSSSRDFCAGSSQLIKAPMLSKTEGHVVDYRTWEGNAPYVTGGGIPGGAALLQPEEVSAGEIRHALRMTVYDSMPGPKCTPAQRATGTDLGVTCGDAVAPAGNFEKDGSAGSATELLQGVPEGTRFALHVTDDEIEAWMDGRTDLSCGADCARRRQTARVLAVALRDYGWFITMSSGYAAAFQFSGGGNPQEQALWQSLGIKGPDHAFLKGLITQERLWVAKPPLATCLEGSIAPTTTFWCETPQGKGAGASTFKY